MGIGVLIVSIITKRLLENQIVGVFVMARRGYICFRCGHAEVDDMKECGCKCHG